MEEIQKKDVGRALTTDEIRLQAHKWNLAGDVGLLAHLENFSQNLFSKSQETQKSLNELFDAFEDTSTTINNVTNQFLALQNSQFVENRVYDDESPAEEPKSDNKVSQEEQENYLLAQYKEAVQIGVNLLDSHFEEVQLPPNSDSDEEEVSVETSGLVWKPKNPYAGKRFPLLIGSAEWWADDNVGLGEYEENVNPETPSSEAESDMEVEDTAEKRIRMSSSSSSESDKILNTKSKEGRTSVFDEMFAPSEKDMFTTQTNLFANGEENNLRQPEIIPRSRENIKPLNLPSVTDKDELLTTKENKNSLFSTNDDEHSEESHSGSAAPAPIHNRLQSALTKELNAKLSVAVRDTEEPKLKNTLLVKPNNKEQSALFADIEDSDDLFSAKTSSSNLLFKKQSIFSDGDPDDELFGYSENLFSGATKVKKSVRISSKHDSDDNAVKENNSNLFDKARKVSKDDLFNNNDDFLFGGKSVLSSSHNSGGVGLGWKNSEEVKFSTPTEPRDNQEVPNSDIFGGVSEIRSNSSSHVESVSAISNDTDNSLNFSRYLSADNSKDYGFIEPSEISNNKSMKSDSSGVFEPRLTSTRHMPSDTSDYKTRASSNQVSTAEENSSTSHSQNNSKGKMGHTEKVHFSRQQSDANKSKGLFEEEDEDEDLFQTSKSSRSVKGGGLFDNNDNDDLFSNLAPPKKNKNHSVFAEPGEDSLFHKSSAPPLDVDEEEKSSLFDKVKQESVSMSSSRSSLFDDVNIGKTNLASVFDNDKSLKTSDDLFGKTNDDLFGENKTINFDENDAEDLFSTSGVKPKINEKDNMSLFDNLEEADDLFSGEASKKLFDNYDDDAELFGKPPGSTKRNVKENSNYNENVAQSEKHGMLKSEASPNNIIQSAAPLSVPKEDIVGSLNISNASDDAFNNFKQSDNIIDVENEIKSRSAKVTSLFGELEDEDEDLFNTFKAKEVTKPISALEKNNSNKINIERSRGIKISEDLVEDDLFQIRSREKSGENKSSEGEKPKESKILSGKGFFDEPEIVKDVCKSENINDNETENMGNRTLKSEEKDLFDIRSSKSKISENRKLFEVDEYDDNKLFNNEPEENIFSKEKIDAGLRPSPPNTLNIGRGLDLGTKPRNFSETDGAVITTEKPKVVGKLNIPANLKINPMNLLPGAVMKKTTPIESSQGLNEQDEPGKDTVTDKQAENAPSLLKCLSKDRVKIQTRRRPQTRRARQEALRSSGIDFQFNIPGVASVASRSRSVDDFEKGTIVPPTIKSNSDTNVNDSVLVSSIKESDSKIVDNTDSSNSIFHSVENSPEPVFSSPLVSNPLSPSTDEEDYFNVPELDTNFEREDQSIFKSNVSDFTNDDTLLFDGAPVLSPMDPTKNLVPSSQSLQKGDERRSVTLNKTENKTIGKIMKSKIVIDDDPERDDDDNLFKGNETKLSGKGVLQNKAEVKSLSNIFDDLDDGDSCLFQNKSIDNLGVKVPKKSLFEENDEDDDLFSDKPVHSSSISKNVKDSVVKNKLNKSNKAEKSKEAFVDPLGLMANPD